MTSSSLQPLEPELTLSGVLTVSALDKSSHIPLTSALQLSLQVVQMVAEAHDRGEIVGVLDAAHLLCRPNGGLSFSNTGGNPIAPELKRGEMPDRLSDVYALGAILYRLLTGRRVETSRLIEPPSHFNPAVDSALDELVLQALDEDPSERPYSARELEDRMLEIFDDLGLEAESKTEATRLISAADLKKKSVIVRPAQRKPMRPARDVVQTVETDDDDDDEYTPPPASSLDKKWLLLAGVSLAAIVLMVVAWPSSSKKHDVAPDPEPVAAKAAPAASPKVEARLVEPTPAAPAASETKSQTKVTKLQVKSTVRKTARRARR
jgi:serine/threonine-protein kinase